MTSVMTALAQTVSVLEVAWTALELYGLWSYGRRVTRGWTLCQRVKDEPKDVQARATVRLARWLALMLLYESLSLMGLVLMLEPNGPASDPADPSAWLVTLLMFSGTLAPLLIGDWNDRRERRAALAALRVLVVDDYALMRDMLQDVLEAEGYRVRAVDSQDATVIIAVWPPDVAVLDLMMLEPDGRTLAMQLMAVAPKARVVLISGRPSDELARIATEVGAAAWLSKPFDIEDLLAAVRGDVKREEQV